jgi:hypothetical protein
MINYFDKKNPDDRLNAILDKISKSGIRKLNKDEKLFLESYSHGKESEINKLLSDRENEKTFISDDGNFIFKLDNIEYIDDVQYINGILIVPDLVLTNKKIIKGELKGSVIVFIDGNLAIDFHNGRHDVFEFVAGLEYELDCFMDDLINKISNEKSNN